MIHIKAALNLSLVIECAACNTHTIATSKRLWKTNMDLAVLPRAEGAQYNFEQLQNVWKSGRIK